eukprot:1654920-Prymnesium_polylepis.1
MQQEGACGALDPLGLRCGVRTPPSSHHNSSSLEGATSCALALTRASAPNDCVLLSSGETRRRPIHAWQTTPRGAHTSTRQHTPAHASTRQRTPAHASTRQHTPAHASRAHVRPHLARGLRWAPARACAPPAPPKLPDGWRNRSIE